MAAQGVPGQTRRLATTPLLVSAGAIFVGQGLCMVPVVISAADPVVWVMGVLFWLFIAWMVWRCCFAHVTVSPEGLVVQNVFATHQLAWREIHSVSMGPWGSGTGAVIHLADGRQIRVFGIQCSIFGYRRPWTRAQFMVNELNAELKLHQH